MHTHLLPLLKTRYTQLGGLHLVRQYAKMGLLWPAAKMVHRHPFSKQTYKQVYLDTVRKVEPMLVKEYRPVMKEIAERISPPFDRLSDRLTNRIGTQTQQDHLVLLAARDRERSGGKGVL